MIYVRRKTTIIVIWVKLSKRRKREGIIKNYPCLYYFEYFLMFLQFYSYLINLCNCQVFLFLLSLRYGFKDARRLFLGSFFIHISCDFHYRI